jgi:hypothetical protein
MNHLGSTEVARLFGVRPRDISDLFYGGILDDSKCVVVGGRRLIPRTYLDTIKRVLLKRGKIKEEAAIGSQ